MLYVSRDCLPRRFQLCSARFGVQSEQNLTLWKSHAPPLFNCQQEGHYNSCPPTCYSARNQLLCIYFSLFLLVFVGLVSSFATVADGVLLHAVYFRLHLGTVSSGEHEENHVACDHGTNRAKEVNCDAIRHLCNSHMSLNSILLHDRNFLSCL